MDTQDTQPFVDIYGNEWPTWAVAIYDGLTKQIEKSTSESTKERLKDERHRFYQVTAYTLKAERSVTV